MDITPIIPKEKNFISSYGVNNFKISEVIYQNPIVIMPNQILQVRVSNVEDFFLQDWQNIFNIKPEIMLVGTGEKHQIIAQNLKNRIKQQFVEISIDEMSTSSACRTYNVLMMEDRNVVAFLMPIL